MDRRRRRRILRLALGPRRVGTALRGRRRVGDRAEGHRGTGRPTAPVGAGRRPARDIRALSSPSLFTAIFQASPNVLSPFAEPRMIYVISAQWVWSGATVH